MSISELDHNRWPDELRRGFAVQRRVIGALIIRQLMTKYGRSNIGFLWIVLEPIILCGGVLVLRTAIQGSDENGVSMVALLWSGYMPLTLWRHISGPGVFMLRRAGHLLYHRRVSLFDHCIATVIMELGGCTIAALLVYAVLYSFKLIDPIYDVATLLMGWLVMGYLATGLMMFFAITTELWEPAERFVQPFQYLMLPICGFLFMVNWFPTSIQKLCWWMPTVHAYEMIRAGLFGPSIPTYYSPWYPILVTTISLAIMLPLVEKAREKIHFG